MLLLLVATATDVDNSDLDGNVVAKLMVRFAWMMNLRWVTVCLPTPRSAEDPSPIFVQDIIISLALELTRHQYNNYSWKFRESIGDVGYTRIVYSCPPGTINASSVWDAKCNYILQPTHKATGWASTAPHPGPKFSEEPPNMAVCGTLLITHWCVPRH